MLLDHTAKGVYAIAVTPFKPDGAVGNMYIVDGLDVSSSIRPGVLNMTPNPDSIQEASPVHESCTVPLNPEAAEKLRTSVTVPPLFTVSTV